MEQNQWQLLPPVRRWWMFMPFASRKPVVQIAIEIDPNAAWPALLAFEGGQRLAYGRCGASPAGHRQEAHDLAGYAARWTDLPVARHFIRLFSRLRSPLSVWCGQHYATTQATDRWPEAPAREACAIAGIGTRTGRPRADFRNVCRTRIAGQFQLATCSPQ